MGNVAPPYFTGKDATVTIGGNTYTNAKSADLPSGTADTVKTLHMGGIAVTPDGMKDYGKFSVAIPEDGGARLTNTTVAMDVKLRNGPGCNCGACYVISDGKAKVQRGSSADRMIEAELLSDGN